MMDEHSSEAGKIQVEEVDAVAPPPKARVDMADEAERKPDYLEGFLSQKPATAATGEPGGDVYEGVIDALKEIYDPEIPVNIYELGLIYGVDVTADNHVVVTMTLTTPHCPVAESMPGEVELRVGAVPGVGSAEVNLVWDPPWDPQKMSDEAKLELGML
ncbi:SUF system Fe-S cluster assembly protein [Rhizorhabdus dicambivorans]|uniref:SUF system Fe-S cluster assembly protein n=1 Tax=Rhizorhabdus dicambivorans TaxID=1850238 RepID=A0A2A4FUU8_9SPHN|nr:SUF system Fe-S cluster assembly protein [Rhizorhabdus dicambivorans]ATE63489.1 SUF system Fe-S cluster assembly protein [Rhizorhabdus dicambivorans]PCE41456.1 SUF system Fe-S cluster assembly protein [Rhizorhabdus dicambivorans]